MSEQLPPAPPSDQLEELAEGDLVTLQAGTLWGRTFWHAGRHPTRWDRMRQIALPSPGRFDPFAAGPDQAVMSVALPYPLLAVDINALEDAGAAIEPGEASLLATALAEVAQAPAPPAAAARLLAMLDRLDQRTFAIGRFTEHVTLLDLTGSWATRSGVGTHLSTAPHVESSVWSASIAARWPELSGVLYASSRRAVFRAAALWAPGEPAISSSLLAFHRTLDDPLLTVPLAWAAHSNGVVLRR